LANFNQYPQFGLVPIDACLLACLLQLITRAVLDPKYSLFKYNPEMRTSWYDEAKPNGPKVK
jgi:hypothetical protein